MNLFRFSWFLLALFSCLCLAAQYSPEDVEIFNVQAKLVQDSGHKDYNFYKFLRLPLGPKSKLKQIESHYRQLSRKWHPDKFRDPRKKKRAEKRFQKLSLVITILRNHEKKQRYDYYLQHGFPHYDKEHRGFVFGHHVKPGFVLAITIVVVLVTVMQYLILKVNYTQSIKRMTNLVEGVQDKVLDELPDGQLICTETTPVLYSDKLFVVKPDMSVWYYDTDVSTPQKLHEACKRITEVFSPKLDKPVKGNRRTRRATAKKMKEEAEKNAAKSHVTEKSIKLLPVKVEDVEPVNYSQLFAVKLVKLPYTLVKAISNLMSRKKVVQPKDDTAKLAAASGKVKLDSGLVIGARKTK